MLADVNNHFKKFVNDSAFIFLNKQKYALRLQVANVIIDKLQKIN